MTWYKSGYKSGAEDFERAESSPPKVHLTPPTSPQKHKDVPFKAKPDDCTSLNLKRRNHSAKVQGLISGTSSSEHLLDDQPNTTNSTSRAFPDDRVEESSSTALPVLTPLTRGKAQIERRWTLPTKSIPIQGLQNTGAVNTNVNDTSRQESSRTKSPAMITLRRATARNTVKDESLTFFPPPQITHPRSSLLSFFLRMMENGTKDCAANSTPQSAFWKLQKADLMSSTPKHNPSATSDIAFPVRTEITDIQPSLSQASQVVQAPFLRRCSTRYLSGDSVYEILWDDNVSSTDSEAVSSATGPTPCRRDSVAVQKLEEQLEKSSSHSRRISTFERGDNVRTISCNREDAAASLNPLQRFLDGRFGKVVSNVMPNNSPNLKTLLVDEGNRTYKYGSAPNEGRYDSTASHPRTLNSGFEFFPTVKCHAWSQLNDTIGSSLFDTVGPLDVGARTIDVPDIEERDTPSFGRRCSPGSLIGARHYTGHRRRNNNHVRWSY